MAAFPLQQNICFPSSFFPQHLKIGVSECCGFGFFDISILGLQHSSPHQYQSLDGRVLWILHSTLTINPKLQIHFHILMATVFGSYLLVKANPDQVQSISLVVLLGQPIWGALVGHLDVDVFGEHSAGRQAMYENFCFSFLALAATRKENS